MQSVPHAMRLRLAHTLSLALLAFAAAAVLVLGGLTAWNLRDGFGNYLAQREVQHLERLVALIQATALREGGLDALQQGRLDLRSLFRELDGREPGTLPPSDPLRPRLPAGPLPFPERVQVFGLDGRLLLGRPGTLHDAGADAAVQRPVVVQGRVVATAGLHQSDIQRDRGETRFLLDQYRVMTVTAGGLMMLALLTATVLARRWTRPLAAVQDATQRLAQGELTVRVPEGPQLTGRSDEIGDVVRNVNRMAEGLERLEGARRRWLADISHELRTPLTVLRGQIEALHDGVRPLAPDAIVTLHKEVLRIGKLVDDLHLLAVSDLKALPCHPGPADAVALLGQLAHRFEPRAAAAGLQLTLSLPAALPTLPVYWDADRVEQLLGNLVDNSLRYTDSPGEILIGLRIQGSRIQMTVDDSAPGVPAQQLGQVFEPLFRGDLARNRRLGGSGLGLAICQAIAQSHDGRIDACASNLGGLRITLDLPRQAAESSPQESART